MAFYHFARVSRNEKIGPMPAVMASNHTCPLSCGMLGKGCYAEMGHVGIHWRKLSEGVAKNALSFEQLLHTIRALPRKIRWHYGAAGDLPAGREAVLQLADANQGRDAIVYTHARDFETYREAGRRGMHINLSADSAATVDELPTDMSVVCVLPSDARRPTTTPAGREIVVCPATFAKNVSCSTCNLCSRPRPRGVVVGFPAHGARKRMIDERLA